MPEALTSTELRAQLAEVFPGALVAIVAPGEAEPAGMLATRDVLIYAERLPEIARYLRDTLGYELLTNVSVTDYLADGIFEVVYHFVDLRGGAPLALKVRVGRDRPEVPSLAPWWPGADFQEREAYDLFGVVFAGHPNLRRIYMWDEFEGFPMRKDFPKQGDKYFGESEG